MGRKRNNQLIFWVSDEERDIIQGRMNELGSSNMSAFIRKIAIDGYIVRLDLPELKEMISLLRRTSNNINQIAKRQNETSRLYRADIQEIQDKQEQLWTAANAILQKLASIR